LDHFYCSVYSLERKLYSAVDCRDAALWFSQQASGYQALADTVQDVNGIPDWLKVKAEKRNLAAAYAHLAGGEV
jgi:hypothetical protein